MDNNFLTTLKGDRPPPCLSAERPLSLLSLRHVVSLLAIALLGLSILATMACKEEKAAATVKSKESPTAKPAKPVDALACDHDAWKYMFSDDRGERRVYFYYNAQLLSVTNKGNPTLWQKTIEVQSSAAQKATRPDKLAFVLQKIEVSCSEEKYRVLELRPYDSEGTPIKSAVTMPKEWSTVVPGTLNHWWFTTGCNSEAKKMYDGKEILREVVDAFSKRK